MAGKLANSLEDFEWSAREIANPTTAGPEPIRRRALDEGEQGHVLPLYPELPSQLECHDPAQTEAADEVGSLRLECPQVRQVVRGEGLDAGEWRLHPVDPGGLERIEWLGRPELA